MGDCLHGALQLAFGKAILLNVCDGALLAQLLGSKACIYMPLIAVAHTYAQLAARPVQEEHVRCVFSCNLTQAVLHLPFAASVPSISARLTTTVPNAAQRGVQCASHAYILHRHHMHILQYSCSNRFMTTDIADCAVKGCGLAVIPCAAA